MRLSAASAALVAAACIGAAQAAGGGLRVSGYAKSLAVASHAADEAGRPTRLLLNRLRLKLDLAPAPHWDLHLENDTEFRWGNAAGAAQWRADDAQPSRRTWHWRSSLSDGARTQLRNDVFRAVARLSLRDTDLRLGRQRIALGTGRLWSTLDLLNPLNPLQVERDEYVGVDALRIDQRLGDLSALTAVYAPMPGGGRPRWVLRGRTHAAGADLGVTLARYWNDRLAGLDVATQWQGIGLRGELTAVRAGSGLAAGSAAGRRHVSALLGADYAFANTLTLSVEAYLSTQDEAQRRRQFATDPLRGQVQPLGTRYAGVVASWEFTPLLKATLVGLVQLRDHSRFGAASLAWSLDEDLVLQAGVQTFGGPRDGEFGRARTLGWLQLQWFFQQR